LGVEKKSIFVIWASWKWTTVDHSVNRLVGKTRTRRDNPTGAQHPLLNLPKCAIADSRQHLIFRAVKWLRFAERTCSAA
jgi:hypothetical protein